MADKANEILETCRVAEEIWEQLPAPVTAIRAQIDRLWLAYERVSVGGTEVIDADLTDVVALSAHVRCRLDHAALSAARTETLLAAWREAEHDLSRTQPGTLSWLIACRALEAARDAYHARVNALLAPSSPPPELSFVDLGDT